MAPTSLQADVISSGGYGRRRTAVVDIFKAARIHDLA